jgi:hypothetical protein
MGQVVINPASTDVANVFTKVQTFRADGGTAGEEIQVYHDKTDGTIWCKEGNLTVRPEATYGKALILCDHSAGLVQLIAGTCYMWGMTRFDPANGVGWSIPTGSHIQGSSGVVFGWSGSHNTAGIDTWLGRGAAGVVRLSGAVDGGTISSIPLSPPQITANQNNYNPGVARNYRLSVGAIGWQITGLVAGVDGEERYLINIGPGTLTLPDESFSSTDVNRFLLPGAASLPVPANSCVRLMYDGTSARWRGWLLQ